MTTTSSTITITKTLRYSVPTSYTTDKVSALIKHEGVEKRFDATAIVNATSSSSGLITFSDIVLWGDGNYSIQIVAEDNVDLDVNGVGMTTLGSGYIRKITNVSTLEI